MNTVSIHILVFSLKRNISVLTPAYSSIHSKITANIYKIVIYIINIQIVKHTMFDIWKKKKKKKHHPTK